MSCAPPPIWSQIRDAAFSVSIGIAAHEGGGADYARIHREADTALHQARAEV